MESGGDQSVAFLILRLLLGILHVVLLECFKTLEKIFVGFVAFLNCMFLEFLHSMLKLGSSFLFFFFLTGGKVIVDCLLGHEVLYTFLMSLIFLVGFALLVTLRSSNFFTWRNFRILENLRLQLGH